MMSFLSHSCTASMSKKPKVLASSLASSALLPGLPDDLALLCLARVPSIALLWRVSTSWRSAISHSTYYHALRASLGFDCQKWLYALLHDESLQSAEPPLDMSKPVFSWHAYDPIANSWHALPPLPSSVKFHLSSPSCIGYLHSVQCASSATKLFMVAGSKLDERGAGSDAKRASLKPALDCPLIFDSQTQKWSEGTPFSVPRKWCACGTAEGKLFVASGCGQAWDKALSRSAEMYDPEAQKWAEIERLRSSAFSRMGMAAVNYKGKLHMVSGVGVTYDPATGRWGDMPRGMKEGWSGQSVVVNGSLFMLDEPSGRLKVYNEVKDEWKCVTPKDDALKGMEQLVGGSCGTFCGIVRKKVVRGDRTVDEDAIRIVDVKGVKPAVKDVRLPFGRVVAVQVLSRMVL